MNPPILPWHKKAAHKLVAAVNPQIATMRDNPDWEPGMYGQRFNDAAKIIAAHDPHAAQHQETVELLQAAAFEVHNIPLSTQIRAHLAALRGKGGAT